MFSYRHSFHAGNHADVLKHLSQMLLLEKLKLKDKGFVYIDTHSGAGLYDLSSEQAQKTNEYQQGITRIADYAGDNKTLNQYLALVNEYQRHQLYPGSPEIARALMRQQDKLILMEWHNHEIDNLRRNLKANNVAIHHRDGFEGLLAMTPPALPRGLVLIDPPYEVATEYQQVIDTVTKAYKKFSSGIFAIWYPLIAERSDKDPINSFTKSKTGKSERLLADLAAQPFKNLLRVELCVTDKQQGVGMYGSGLAIINAPWQFDSEIDLALGELSPLLAQSDTASYKVEWLIAESGN